MAAISQNTNVRLGVVGGILLAILTSLGVIIGGVWWASALNTKVDALLDEVKRFQIVDGRVSALEIRNAEHEARLKVIEKTK